MPKGVMNEHRAVVNRLIWMQQAYGLTEHDAVLQKTPFGFDVSVWEFFWPLLAGARLVMARPEGHKDPVYLAALIRDQRITTLHFVPSMLQVFADHEAIAGCTGLKRIICSGEALPGALVRRVKEMLGATELHNLYGPTEAAIDVTAWACTTCPDQTPIGRPIANTRIYILDRHGEPVPVGVAGEIHIGGVGVARGYLNRPELTAERFLADPFADEPGARMYRTGDLGRFLPDGNIEYLGRNDFQVKIRGFRIELGEIEAQLAEHAGVREAVVVAREDVAGEKRLVAYMILDESASGRDTAGEAHLLTDWRTVYDEAYGADGKAAFGEDFGVWISSYDSRPIPTDAMREWRDATVSSILSLGPKHVLEIGVGSGLILSQLAPRCETYWATDFSENVIEHLRSQVAVRPGLAGRVNLRCQAAHVQDGLPASGFDTIVINSVIQYFPSEDYLMKVLRAAIAMLKPGGAVFVGDVRSLPLLPCLAASVQLTRADAGMDAAAIQRSVEHRLATEKELALDPEFFVALQQKTGDVGAVDIRIKRGRASNELTRFRFDVVLRKGSAEAGSLKALPRQRWGAEIGDFDALERALLEHRATGLRVIDVPNARLTHQLAALQMLQERVSVEAAGRELREPEPSPHPEDFYALGAELGFEVMATWSGSRELGKMDVVFLPPGLKSVSDVYCRVDTVAPARRLANVPLYDDGGRVIADVRRHLSARLPEYMVPAAFVRLDGLPLTPNGKLDRKALPAPDEGPYARREYEAPQGVVEERLAAIWQEVLGVARVGRRDNFFELGGHSLLAVRLISRMRQASLSANVRMLFGEPTLSALARAVRTEQAEFVVPANRIVSGCAAITPEMLPLVELTQAEIDRIVAGVPGGAANVQDIYPLAPLQEGILYHHLLAREGDPYLLTGQMAFADRALLERYLEAVQGVVDRHDILRTSFVWEGMSSPVQVVWRCASLSVTEIELDPAAGAATEQLARRYDPRRSRIELGQAPLMRFVVAWDAEHGRWLLLVQEQHLIGDHAMLEVLNTEVGMLLSGRGQELPAALPFRNHVAQARLGVNAERHEAFFREMLSDVDEPTLPYGLSDVQGDGSGIEEAHRMLAPELNARLRAQARRLGVSLASLSHVAWGQVVARTSGRERVVFGTVLLGRTQGGAEAERAMGMFINTLPLRVDLDATGVAEGVRRMHLRLSELLEHEHAPLVLAQRCSAVAAGVPLFSALLNHRHNSLAAEPSGADALSGGEWLNGDARTNYPFDLSVEDFGEALGVMAQVLRPVSAERVCAYMEQALASLADALEHAPDTRCGR
jgi:non-ribosomal peptide synthetase component F/ubiquinone/menaquinone biosynthesis C-methylase UbiE